MAGTGKSTISRTFAQFFADKGQLGGSLFFKRGENYRGNASMFFTTIVSQVTTEVPTSTPFIREAIDADTHISDKPLKEQFKKLILLPLSNIQSVSPESRRLILAVDTLDECERQDNIMTRLGLLSQFGNLTSVCPSFCHQSIRPPNTIRISQTDASHIQRSGSS